MQARKTCVYLSLSVSIIKPEKSGSAARKGAPADERTAVYVGKLSAWEKKLLEFYDKNDKFILPISRRNEVINFVKNGL